MTVLNSPLGTLGECWARRQEQHSEDESSKNDGEAIPHGLLRVDTGLSLQVGLLEAREGDARVLVSGFTDLDRNGSGRGPGFYPRIEWTVDGISGFLDFEVNGVRLKSASDPRPSTLRVACG